MLQAMTEAAAKFKKKKITLFQEPSLIDMEKMPTAFEGTMTVTCLENAWPVLNHAIVALRLGLPQIFCYSVFFMQLTQRQLLQQYCKSIDTSGRYLLNAQKRKMQEKKTQHKCEAPKGSLS